MTTRVQQFDFSVGLLAAVLWQYNDAKRLLSLLYQKDAWYLENQTEFWENWITDVFDLRTANAFGLAVWARILNIPLVAGVPGTGDRPVFGFGDFNLNFENGNFGRDSSGTVDLTIEQQRMLLQLRYYQLTTNADVPEVNAIMADIFGPGVYALDGLNMHAVYVFETPPSSSVLFVLQKFDVLPRPAGVGVGIVVSPGQDFGFAPFYRNFENGTFGA